MIHPQRKKLKPSLFDLRDRPYIQTGLGLRRHIDLREWDSVIEDQGDLGSCAGNALANAYELMVKRQQPDKFTDISRLFIYYNARRIEETISEDAGVIYLRNALKGMKLYGACSEQLWPYIIENFDDAPPPIAYADGMQRCIKNYESLRSITDMLEALNMDNPIVIGMDIFDDFVNLTKTDCILKIPESDTGSLGTHALIIVGYSLVEQHFLIKNSFGRDWGDDGYAWMPFDYAKKHVFERWIFNI